MIKVRFEENDRRTVLHLVQYVLPQRPMQRLSPAVARIDAHLTPSTEFQSYVTNLPRISNEQRLYCDRPQVAD